MARPVKHRGKWRIRWLDERGVRQSAVFDAYNDAAFKLRERQQAVEEIRRGLRRADPTDRLFDELCDYWLTKRNVMKRSRKDDKSIIRKHLRPAFGPLLIREVTVERTDAFVAERIHLHKNTIAHLLTLLISTLNLAVELGWLIKVPKIRKPKVRLFSRDFRYLRTEEEITRFLRAAQWEGDLVFTLYATAVFTGMREGELAALTWEDINFERRLITVQRSFDGPTKADDVRYVPILDPLVPVLREWRLKQSGSLLFPNHAGKRYAKSGRIFQECLGRVLDAAGFPKIERNGKPRGYIVFHDLRHTFASHWAMRGGDMFRLQKILGHKSIAMTMRYAHLQPEVYVSDHSRLGTALRVDGGEIIALPARG